MTTPPADPVQEAERLLNMAADLEDRGASLLGGNAEWVGSEHFFATANLLRETADKVQSQQEQIERLTAEVGRMVDAKMALDNDLMAQLREARAQALEDYATHLARGGGAEGEADYMIHRLRARAASERKAGAE